MDSAGEKTNASCTRLERIDEEFLCQEKYSDFE
jgi:hypothetical protein